MTTMYHKKGVVRSNAGTRGQVFPESDHKKKVVHKSTASHGKREQVARVTAVAASKKAFCATAML